MDNSEVRFSQIPTVEKPRSIFDRSFSHKTTLNTGDLIPLSWDEVYPGDTISMDFAHVTRMTTPIAPVMDNSVLDIYAFFVPNRLIWEHAKEFWGENNTTHWEQPIEYYIPQIDAPTTTGWAVGSLADYLGLPVGIPGIQTSALPFRAYCKIINDWFRDENLKDPCNMNINDTTVQGINDPGHTYDYVTDTQLGAKPFKVAKMHDYFTSALPSPQKGPDVTLPLGTTAPVHTYDAEQSITGIPTTPLKWYTNGTFNQGSHAAFISTDANGVNTSTAKTTAGTEGGLSSAYPSNLYADLGKATAATINQLRQAFAVQRFYEAQARGGSRYIEFVHNIFGVTSPDARQQRAEYCGGKRFPINVDQVLQTSSTDSVTPQGNTAAYSCTINADNLATYSSTEHGIFMVVGCIRTVHTYQQGVNKSWLRKKWSDFYVPQFAHLGEQAIINEEIYAQGTSADKQAFGYQEAWADLRYKPSYVTGKMRSGITGSLDIWHYADHYTSQPYLSSDWIDETEANVQRTLAVQTEPQFIMDTHFKTQWTRILPTYSVPGLLDHF